jgi:hypothetical protein
LRIGLAMAALSMVPTQPASANVGCAMSCPDNSPDSSCMRSCSAWSPEGGQSGSSGSARRYGAIAISPSTLDYGTSYRFPSRKQAEEAALTYCHGNASKPKDCQISSWFWNQCGSLALNPKSSRSPGHWGSAWGGSRESARKKALAACSKVAGVDCKTMVTFCS